jgi:septal ring-binding cell division protein DamX
VTHTAEQPLNLPATAAGRNSNADCNSTEWILNQPAANYTIQLIAANNEKKVLQYIMRHPRAQEISCFSFNKDGDHWYSVIYKSFPSYSLAKAGLKELSSTKAKPWIRKFSGIHKIIDKASTK